MLVSGKRGVLDLQAIGSLVDGGLESHLGSVSLESSAGVWWRGKGKEAHVELVSEESRGKERDCG